MREEEVSSKRLLASLQPSRSFRSAKTFNSSTARTGFVFPRSISISINTSVIKLICLSKVAIDVAVSRIGLPMEETESIATFSFSQDVDQLPLASWTPKEAGTFSITVKINDEPIGNTPRVLTVLDRLSILFFSSPCFFSFSLSLHAHQQHQQ